MWAAPVHRFLIDDVSLADYDVPTIAGHRQVTDVHLLTLARRRGVRLVTFDRTIDVLAPPPGHVHSVQVVADLADPLLGERSDEVLADHGVHQRVGSGGQVSEARTRQGVPGQHHRGRVVRDPEADSRRHRPVIGGCHGDLRAVTIPDLTRGVGSTEFALTCPRAEEMA